MFTVIRVGEGRGPLVEPLDEVDLALVLPGPGRPQRPALAGEAHEAAVVAGVLEGRVVVLQNDLGEYAVHPPTVGLRRERGMNTLWSTLILIYNKQQDIIISTF